LACEPLIRRSALSEPGRRKEGERDRVEMGSGLDPSGGEPGCELLEDESARVDVGVGEPAGESPPEPSLPRGGGHGARLPPPWPRPDEAGRGTRASPTAEAGRGTHA